MAGLAQIETRCFHIAKTVGSACSDEIVLLRAARIMKRIHTDLRRAVWERVRMEGWTESTTRAEVLLDAIEQDLRRLLLDYPSLCRSELRDHLVRLTDEFFQTLDLLAG